MKKRILALLLVATMVLALGACGKKEPTDTNITIWVADNTVDFTKEQAAKWQATDEAWAAYTINVEPVGEGDAAGNMIVDVTGGADIFAFAQDQLARLVSAGVLTAVAGDNAKFVQDSNIESAVNAAKLGNTIYAYPFTADNGYFLYYDKSVVTDVSSLEKIIAQCETAGKNFYYDIRSGWYNTAFFFAADCKVTYETDDDGKFTACNVNYASDNGVAALKAILKMIQSPAFVNGSSIGSGTDIGAISTGIWDKKSATDLWGADGYGCVKLPTVNIGGKDVQMSGFSGYKLMGIKPQEDSAKLKACHSLVQFLTGEECQIARFRDPNLGWGPSNKNAQAIDEVKNDKHLMAVADQSLYTIPQGPYPNSYWSDCESFGDSLIAGEYNNATDAQLMDALKGLEDKFKGAVDAQ